ncbi:MAG TPA: LlaJI family restriction endonuclease [Candidatus Ligilactobacillus avistercoris]|nr:LlaJI family restriction endonuclease [Candidatus Ligilactobacillus avistercoris]
MKKNNLHYFVDGHSYSEEKVPECIREYFIKSNNNYKLQAVGLIIERNTSYIFLPHNTSLCDELTNTDIQNLVQVMIIVNNLFYNSNGDRLIDKQLSDKYSVIKWLIEDYHNFGIYSPTSRISCKKDKGIINWNKSIKKIRPVFINNEAYILDFFRTKKIQTEDIVSDIQRVVLSEISDNFGGIFNDFKYRLHNDELRFLKEDREYLKRDYREHLINILRCRLSTINAMRERTLVKNLITYLGLGDVDNLTVVTKEFHVIFEKIMKVALEDKEDLHKYVPTAQWDFTINGHEYSPHNNQIPDALVEKNNSLYIYDVK